MAVTFFTPGSSSQALLDEFDARIEQRERKAKITTWEKSNDGNYYTHKATEWTKKAWFKPAVAANKLIFNIIKPGNMNVTAVAYAYYHGHLIETFLNHFDNQFSAGQSSAMPAAGDVCA